MARRKHPDFRELDGILLLDKATGISSNQALQQARRLFGAEKGGHTGSLDPLATGLLPLCFGDVTKIAGLLLAERKAYEVVATLGSETDTGDSDGVATSHGEVPAFDRETVLALLQPFVGRIRQVPPVYSALKRDGEALYVKARRGEVVEVEARDVEIHSIELLALGASDLRLRVECGSGTYIRSLVRDLGRAIGCGAHVSELRRLWVEPFRHPRMYRFDQLQEIAAGGAEPLEALLLPVEAGVVAMARVDLDADQSCRLVQGQAIPIAVPAHSGEKLVAYSPDGRALGLVRDGADGTIRPARMFRAATGWIPA
jgi:tRNA pseudouridine55 synthase